jgi:hypothetical protein
LSVDRQSFGVRVQVSAPPASQIAAKASQFQIGIGIGIGRIVIGRVEIGRAVTS